jgi:hypothetical protein
MLQGGSIDLEQGPAPDILNAMREGMSKGNRLRGSLEGVEREAARSIPAEAGGGEVAGLSNEFIEDKSRVTSTDERPDAWVASLITPYILESRQGDEGAVWKAGKNLSQR